MSENESPAEAFNKYTGLKVQKWREALQLSQADMADILAYANQSPVDVSMVAKWEAGTHELPGYLFCFIEHFYQSSIDKFITIAPGAVMQEKEALVQGVLVKMRENMRNSTTEPG